jgi:hypothetical protein
MKTVFFPQPGEACGDRAGYAGLPAPAFLNVKADFPHGSSYYVRVMIHL